MGNLIYKKMSEVMKEVGPVTKTNKNTVQGYKFRSIDNMINALHPALVKHGVFMVPECVNEAHEIKEVTRSNGKAGVDKHVHVQIKFHFYAEDGSSVTAGPIPGEGLDSGDKATNKAMSAALKYALIQTFCVPTEDLAEADLESPEIVSSKMNVITAEKAPEPLNLTPLLSEEKKPSSFRKQPSGTNGTSASKGGWE